MKITPFMTEETLTDGVYSLPDGRVFRAQYLPYFRPDDVGEMIDVPVQSLDAPKVVTADALEALIANLVTPEALKNFGSAYVHRQLDWAESELQKLLASQSSSMVPPAAQQGGQAIVANERKGGL